MNSYEDLVNLPMRMYEPSQRSPERDVADTSAASENLSYQSTDYLGALGAEDVSLSRRLAIRTRCFDDFFEDCTLPPRCIKQVCLELRSLPMRQRRTRKRVLVELAGDLRISISRIYGKLCLYLSLQYSQRNKK